MESEEVKNNFAFENFEDWTLKEIKKKLSRFGAQEISIVSNFHKLVMTMCSEDKIRRMKNQMFLLLSTEGELFMSNFLLT